MRRNDGRKLDHKALEAIRICAVEQVEAGENPEVVVKALGTSRPRADTNGLRPIGRGYAALKARLISGIQRPVFLIVDGHPTHRAVKVKKFVAATEGRLRLFFLPPCSGAES